LRALMLLTREFLTPNLFFFLLLVFALVRPFFFAFLAMMNALLDRFGKTINICARLITTQKSPRPLIRGLLNYKHA